MTTPLNNLILRTISDSVSLARTLSDQNFDQALQYRLHQMLLKSMHHFLELHPAPAVEDQTPAERELYSRVEHQLTYYLGDKE